MNPELHSCSFPVADNAKRASAIPQRSLANPQGSLTSSTPPWSILLLSPHPPPTCSELVNSHSRENSRAVLRGPPRDPSRAARPSAARRFSPPPGEAFPDLTSKRPTCRRRAAASGFFGACNGAALRSSALVPARAIGTCTPSPAKPASASLPGARRLPPLYPPRRELRVHDCPPLVRPSQLATGRRRSDVDGRTPNPLRARRRHDIGSFTSQSPEISAHR